MVASIVHGFVGNLNHFNGFGVCREGYVLRRDCSLFEHFDAVVTKTRLIMGRFDRRVITIVAGPIGGTNSVQI